MSQQHGDTPKASQILERVSEGVLTVDEEYTFTYANSRALDVLAADHDDVVGAGLWETLPAADDSEKERVERAIETQEEATYEVSDDDQGFSVRLYPDANGATILFRDVTEQRRREQQIQELHETTRQLIAADSVSAVAECLSEAAERILDLIAHGVHIYDEEAGGLKPVAVSERSRNALGDVPVLDDGIAWEVYQRGEGQVHGDVRTVEEVYNEGTPIRSEMVLPLADVGVFIVSSTDVDAFDENDVMLGKLLAQNAARVLEEMSTREELDSRRQELEQADALFEHAQDAFFIVDVGDDAFTIERVNPAYEELTGFSNEEMAGQTIGDLFGETDGAKIRERYEQCVDRGEPVEYVEQLDVPEPDTYWETHVAPVVVDGEVVKLVGATRNVSEQRRRQKRLERQRDELELLNEMVRHDIRNDLQVISTHAELLERHADEDTEDYARKVLESAETAIELTRTARELAGTMLQDDDQTQPTPLRSVLRTQVEEVQTSYTDAIVTVEGSIPGVSVTADEMLSSVFRNVIKNAIEHNDADVPEVTVKSQLSEDTVRVSVADNGPGISDSQKAALFGRGERGMDSPGTGIGLYLVDTLVSRYGGSVRVDDNEPRGTVVTVTLPRAD